MAHPSEVKIQPAPDAYPKCPKCGWWDRKLRIVGKAMTPEERVALHMWGKHDAPFPKWMEPPPEKVEEP